MTLLYSNMPEVKYVALRNVLLLIQKRPDILQDEMKVRARNELQRACAVSR